LELAKGLRSGKLLRIAGEDTALGEAFGALAKQACRSAGERLSRPYERVLERVRNAVGLRPYARRTRYRSRKGGPQPLCVRCCAAGVELVFDEQQVGGQDLPSHDPTHGRRVLTE